MGLSAARKIIARAAGRREIATGDHVVVRPDWTMTYDPQAGPLRQRWARHWGDEAHIFAPERLILVADHFMDLANPVHAQKQADLDQLARQFGIAHYYPVGAENYGVCHALLPEEGLVRPGELICGTDSHSSTYGGFGALGLNIGLDALEGIVALGEHWMEIPREIRVEISGRFPEGVTAKDVILKLCADLTGDPLVFGAAIELDGEAIQALHPEEKLTLANMAQEMGARWILVPANDTVQNWVAGLGAEGFAPVLPDPDAAYERVLHYRGEAFEPMVALPGGPERAVAIAGLGPTRFNEIFVGSCTGAKRYDMERFFEIVLAGEATAPDVSVMLVPATRKTRDWIFSDPARERWAKDRAIKLADQPGCNACAGIHGYLAGETAVRMSTANRNYAGRAGSLGAQIYLGSAETAARVALTGRLG
jgi:homoaconitase/3-isopropylmalate dehydratase large subunit